MTFNYLSVTPSIKRPIIPILVKSEVAFIFYSAIIDSGADHCIFSKDLASLLDIKLLKKNQITLKGVGRGNIEGFFGEISIRIGQETYQARVIFADITDFGHGILGQKGFFDHFDVKLSYQKRHHRCY